LILFNILLEGRGFMTYYKFNRKEQHFEKNVKELLIPEYPITITLQITRKCNLRCIYCSETGDYKELNLNELEILIKNLIGVNRIIVAGGEPTLRSDLIDILKICRDNFEVVVLATNATKISSHFAKKIASHVDYVDVTIDGPRNIHNIIRGQYDDIIQGIWNLNTANIEFSIVTVLLSNNEESLPFIGQIVDTLGAKKWKILSPIPKGRGKSIINRKLNSNDILNIYNLLKDLKEKYGWKTRITITDWSRINEGHALLIHPNGDIVASPVWSNSSCISYVGNIMKENIQAIWSKYQYKENHLKKYIENTLLVC